MTIYEKKDIGFQVKCNSFKIGLFTSFLVFIGDVECQLAVGLQMSGVVLTIYLSLYEGFAWFANSLSGQVFSVSLLFMILDNGCLKNMMCFS